MIRALVHAVAAVGIFASCATTPSRAPIALARHGSLAAMLHEKRTEGVVSLLDVAPGPHAYAVGALAGLAGEVTIVDDAVWLSRPRPDTTVEWTRTRRSEARACLLVSARVESWSEHALPASADLAGLERELPRIAREAGLDVDEPFPFLIEGELRRVAFHVIDGSRLVDTGDLHADHLRASRRYEREGARARLVGFHSTRDQGVFTHRDATVHVHATFDDTLQSGHVDELELGSGARLFLPR